MGAKPARLAEILKAAGVGSQLELLLLNRLERAGLPVGEAQYRFVPGRLYRWDRAWTEIDGRAVKVAVEVQGGTWVPGGAHSRGSGIERDCLKFSIGAALGWRVLPISRKMLESGEGIALIAQALGLSESGVSPK